MERQQQDGRINDRLDFLWSGVVQVLSHRQEQQEEQIA
jgi:hypothetical protein